MVSNTKKKTVVVAMSGGVDSSVAAALLLNEGYNVIGVTMKTYDFDDIGGNVTNEASCCGLGAIYDARLVAAKLGIPHYVVDFREAFGNRVINYFVDEYMNGRTPNPCVVCNRDIKWGELLQKADSLGADYIATGHYARVRFHTETNRYVIARAKFCEKDQSYALWAVSQTALSKTLFPLGEMRKPEVRALAHKLGLRTAPKNESYEICFVPDNDYSRFLRERIDRSDENIAEGDIVWKGKVVGKHQGYPFYTVGQRRGIGSFGQKMYVTEIEARTNTLHVGVDQDLRRRGLIAQDINWVGIPSLHEEIRVEAQVRYKDDPAPASAYPSESGFRVVFDEPKRAITPGQSVVLYQEDEVIGGGIIEEILD